MGGKAFHNTRRVNRTEVLQVLVDLDRQFDAGGYFSRNVLGSAGKSTSSGDIDINMCLTRFDSLQFLRQITHLVSSRNVINRPSHNQIFTSYAIPGTEDRVQVDFMFTHVPVWQEFSYASPGDHSAFKGLYRTELIKAAVAFNSNWTLMEEGQLVARIGPTFFHDRGIVWRHRHRPMRRDGRGRVQQLTQISPEEFRALYPQAPRCEDAAHTHPSDVSQLIFDEPGKYQDSFFSYETLTDALREFYDASSYHTILQIYLERLNSLKAEVPQEILDEIHSAAGATAGT
jgi:hypothetical protein